MLILNFMFCWLIDLSNSIIMKCLLVLFVGYFLCNKNFQVSRHLILFSGSWRSDSSISVRSKKNNSRLCYETKSILLKSTRLPLSVESCYDCWGLCLCVTARTRRHFHSVQDQGLI